MNHAIGPIAARWRRRANSNRKATFSRERDGAIFMVVLSMTGCGAGAGDREFVTSDALPFGNQFGGAKPDGGDCLDPIDATCLPTHEEITVDALSFLRPEVRNLLALGNATFDAANFTHPTAHFDNCTFSGSSQVIRSNYVVAVDHALEFPNSVSCRSYYARDCDVPSSGNDAIAFFSRVLHTTQDFYAHTNWVELGNSGRLIDDSLDEFPPFVPYTLLPRIGGAVIAEQDLPGWVLHAPSDPLTYPSSVLPQATYRGRAFAALISGEVDRAIGDEDPKLCPRIVGRGAHVITHEELAKDDPTVHVQQRIDAMALARRQTKHEWCRFVRLVHARHGAEGIRTLCDHWIDDRAGARSACPALSEEEQCGDFYSNDFETAIGPEWTITAGQGSLAIDSAGGGGPGLNFLGIVDSSADGGLGNNTVTLTLAMPTHTEVTVSFDFYGIRSLDGGFNCCGPDYFVFNVGSFNRTTTFGGPTQAFPNFLELGGTPADNAAYAGNNGFLGPLQNAVSFPMSFTVAHSDPTLVVNFSMSGLQGVLDEGWGLDNVRVSFRTPSP